MIPTPGQLWSEKKVINTLILLSEAFLRPPFSPLLSIFVQLAGISSMRVPCAQRRRRFERHHRRLRRRAGLAGRRCAPWVKMVGRWAT